MLSPDAQAVMKRLGADRSDDPHRRTEAPTLQRLQAMRLPAGKGEWLTGSGSGAKMFGSLHTAASGGLALHACTGAVIAYWCRRDGSQINIVIVMILMILDYRHTVHAARMVGRLRRRRTNRFPSVGESVGRSTMSGLG